MLGLTQNTLSTLALPRKKGNNLSLSKKIMTFRTYLNVQTMNKIYIAKIILWPHLKRWF